MAVHGTVEPGFEAVRDVFERSVEKDELGAAVCAYVDGREVVDLWGGWADAARTREWERDTITCVYSVTKAMTATCAHQLVDRGLLDVDEPVATYWPEFAQAGKEKITVRMVLSHQAGLPYPKVGFPSERRFAATRLHSDRESITDALARSSPVWEPGTKSEYHGGSFGYLVGEIVKRIDGRPLSTYLREEVAEQLGADLMIEFGPEYDHRCAEMVGDDDDGGGSWTDSNSRKWRSAGDGAGTGHGSAAGLARLFAALARGGELDGVQVLRPETIDAATQEQPLAHGEGPAGEFGLGYMLLWKTFPFGTHKPFGHTGMSGSIGLADPAQRLGFGYVMNKMGSGGATALLPAIYKALAA